MSPYQIAPAGALFEVVVGARDEGDTGCVIWGAGGGARHWVRRLWWWW